MKKRTEKEEYRTKWGRSEEEETERNGKHEYRTWWERSEEEEKRRIGKHETERNRKDENPPLRETFDGKQTEKTAKRKVCTRKFKKALT